MLDHCSLGVRDLDRAQRFYGAALAPLGYRCLRALPDELAFGSDDAWAFWLYPVAAPEPIVGARAHVALAAPSPAAVEGFAAAVGALGATIVRPPGLRPDISPRYFGTVVRDLDGHTIEVVHWSAAS